MSDEPVVIIARQPALTVREPEGDALTRSLFIIEVILLFVAVVLLNVVVDQGIFMWSMTVFGAVVIAVLLSAAGAHLFTRKKQH